MNTTAIGTECRLYIYITFMRTYMYNHNENNIFENINNKTNT